MDNSVAELFKSMNALYVRITNFRRRVSSSGTETVDVGEDVLLRVAEWTMKCSYFIQDYCLPSFGASGAAQGHGLSNTDPHSLRHS